MGVFGVVPVGVTYSDVAHEPARGRTYRGESSELVGDGSSVTMFNTGIFVSPVESGVVSAESCSVLVTVVTSVKLSLIGEDDIVVSNLGGAMLDRVREWLGRG